MTQAFQNTPLRSSTFLFMYICCTVSADVLCGLLADILLILWEVGETRKEKKKKKKLVSRPVDETDGF